MINLKNGSKILFQGDSITDAGRIKDKPMDMGNGYAAMVKAIASVKCPDIDFTYINRGISGNRSRDLAARWNEDCIDLKPDLVSIMIGINDTWRRYDRNDPTTASDYEKAYRSILKKTKEETDAKILILEPFLLPYPENRKEWRDDLDPKIQVVRDLVAEFKTEFVPLDGIFAKYIAKKPIAYWSADGVHPTKEGHMLIAHKWYEAVFG